MTVAAFTELHEEVRALAKEKDAVILAHNYQRPEVQDVVRLLRATVDEAAADGLGGTGVLVTGSVVTAGDARSLLGAGGGAGGVRGGGADLG